MNCTSSQWFKNKCQYFYNPFLFKFKFTEGVNYSRQDNGISISFLFVSLFVSFTELKG